MHSNALANEKSPYLRQHAHNPVDWLPWGEAAFEKARSEEKPIFLSIGYSTCHWCHVMAHESFEDEQIAAVLNRFFIPIKVDREERPDVDRIYMLFVQASTGAGGWPMSVWLTPELKPFFGGTYYPPDSRYGRPGFKEVLEHLARAWSTDRTRIEQSGNDVTRQLDAIATGPQPDVQLEPSLFEAPFWQLRRMFDARWGGFGNAPKFPRPVVFNYLLRFSKATENEEALDMTAETLLQMSAGGMHDHLGAGFHRYSVDERWFVPHFEKMLYDQAQLATSYLEAFQITNNERFAEVARGIFAYVLRDLRDPCGAFYSAEDADSPDPANPSHCGEGAFYIWSQGEIEGELGKELSAIFSYRFGVTANGNVQNDPQREFVGRNILYEAASLADTAARFQLTETKVRELLAQGSHLLLSARANRPRPHLDDKILCSWNALMISALVAGHRILGEESLLEAARDAADFLLSKMYEPASGRLLRRCCAGEAAIFGFLDDYAFLVQALLDLFEATFDPSYFGVAVKLANHGLSQFEDEEGGGFFSTPAQTPDLLLRLKDDYDGAEPSGNSVAIDLLLRLGHLTGDENYTTRAMRGLRAAAPKLKSQATAAPQLAAAFGRSLQAPAHTIIRCAEFDAGVRALLASEWKKFDPGMTTIVIPDERISFFGRWPSVREYLDRKNKITVYRCRNFICELPEVIEADH